MIYFQLNGVNTFWKDFYTFSPCYMNTIYLLMFMKA